MSSSQQVYLSENIKALRKQQELTQKEFGALFGMGRGTVNNYERGARPVFETLYRIIQHFNLNLYAFVYQPNGHLQPALQQQNQVDKQAGFEAAQVKKDYQSGSPEQKQQLFEQLLQKHQALLKHQQKLKELIHQMPA